MKTTKYALVLALGLIALVVPRAARADDFTFSFTGPLGTVTGEIFGLTNNMTGAATDVTITSFPAAFAGDPALISPVTDLFSAPWFPFANTFTEASGVLSPTSNFKASTSTGLTLVLAPTATGAIGSLTETANGTPNTGEQSVSYSPVATPEPSSFSLILIGFGSIGLMMVMRKRIARRLPKAA